MKSVFDFFQKGKRDPRSKSKPATEHKTRLLPEARFSADENGRKISMSWEKYMARVLVEQEESHSPRPEHSQRQEYHIFIKDFITQYENVLCAQRNEPLFCCEDDKAPASIDDTWGHPTEVVLHVAKLLLEYIYIDDGESIEGKGKAHEWLAEERPVDADKLLLSDSINVIMRKIFDSDENPSSDSSTAKQVARAHFVYTVQALAIISFWPHNRNVLVEHLGRNYARLLIQIMRAFVGKLEEVIVGHIERGKKAESLTETLSAEELGLEQDTSFILHALVSLVHIISRSSTSLCKVAGTIIDYGETIPVQPWSLRDRKQFGYHDIHKYVKYLGVLSGGNDGRESEQGGPMSPHRRSQPTSSQHGASVTPESRGRSSTSAYYMSHENVSQLSSEESQDTWSAFVMQGGAIRALISLLNKLAYLSRAMASPTLYQPNASSSSSCEGESRQRDQDQTDPSTSASYGSIPWSGCVALQCECLVALLAFASSHPAAMCNRFGVCNGAGVICSLLSMQDTPPYSTINRADFQLGFHRGLLCLKLVEQMVLSMSYDISGADPISVKDSLLSLDNLQLFMAWMQTYFVTQNCLGMEGQFLMKRLRDMKLRSYAVSVIGSSAPSSEMWPWSSIPQFMYSSGNTREGLAPSFDDSTAEVDVDLCDWGPVMLHYADNGTFLQKYLKSMKHTKEYSLLNAAGDVFEGRLCSPDTPMPWFVLGFASETWNRLFASLFAICVATQAGDSKKRTMDDNWVARMKLLSSIMSNLLMSLHVCAEAQSVLSYDVPVSDNTVDGSIASSMEREASLPSVSHLPVFQIHMIHFIGMLLQTFPDETITTCRHHKTWSLLATSSSFLLGGKEEIMSLLLKGRRDVSETQEGKFSSGSKKTTTVWSLHADDDEDSCGEPPPRISTSLHFKPTPGKSTGPNRSMLFSMDTGDEVMGQSDEESADDEVDRRMRFESMDSTGMHSADDTGGNETSFFDVEDEPIPIRDDGASSTGLSLGNSPLDETFLPSTSPGFDRTLAGSLDDSFTTPETGNIRDIPTLEVEEEDDGEWKLSDQARLRAFAWLSLFDCVFQLMQMVGEETEKQFPASSGFVKAPNSDSTTELYAFLQAVGRDTPDYVILQTMNWIRYNLSRERTLSESLRVPANDKFKHILFKCLSLSKYQLLTSCDTSGAPPTAENGAPPFWIGEQYEEMELLRPFLWPARCAVISVVKDIMTMAPGKSWFKAFLPKSVESGNSGRGQSSKEAISTPKHVTLLLLILDPRCRSVALYLLMEVLHVSTCLCHSIPIDLRRSTRSAAYSNQSSGIAPRVLNDTSIKKQNTKLDENSSKTVHHAIFHDIVKCLFVSHVKYAMLQPKWCRGAEIVASIYQCFKSFLGNPDRVPYLQYYQNMLLLYGQAGPHHFALNWAKPRPHVFRELFLSVDECIKRSGVDAHVYRISEWTREIRLSILRHFLAMLTALMLGSDITKHRFTSLMLLKKYSKNKAKVTSSTAATEGATWAHPYSACNFHDVAGMINTLEPSPTLETILILFDMLLDGPCQDNRQLIEGEIMPPEGLFFNEESKVCLSNMVVIPIILLLVPSCTLPLQQCIFFSIRNLLVGRFALVNLSKCGDAQPPVFDSLLDLFLLLPDETRPLCVELMQVIGRHNVSVAQLKRLFRLMHTKGDFRPKYTWMLLKSLRMMINNSKRPKHFFLFEGGVDSGLRIPTIHRWPAASGYSCCFWFCVRSPNHLRQEGSTVVDIVSPTTSASRSMTSFEDSLVYRPTLLSVRQNSGIGFEIFLQANSSHSRTYTLVIQTHKDESENSSPSRVEVSVILDESLRQKPIRGGEWYFLAVSHSAGKFRSRSEVSVLLNNYFSRHQLSFPKFLGEIEEPMIGCCTPALASVNCTSTLRGQIGSIYMFSDALSEAQLRKLYNIGMDLSRDLDNSLIAKRATAHSSDTQAQPAFNLDSISSAVMLAYNPGVWDGNFFLDMTPEKNAVRWGKESRGLSRGSLESGISMQTQARLTPSKFAGKMHAFMLPGTYRCTSRDMRDALDCLGGKRVLIPLFAQFDLPSQDTDGSPNYKVDINLCNEVMSLFFALSREGESNPHSMAHSGFQLISYFLERISPEYLTEDLLKVFVDNSQSMTDNKEWYEGVVKFILLNFKLWMFASYETQTRLFHHLLRLCQKSPKDMRNLITVRELFDALYIIYSHPLSSNFSTAIGGEAETEDSIDVGVGVGIDDDVDIEDLSTDEGDFDDRASSASAFNGSPRPGFVRQGSVYTTSNYVHEATGKVVAEKLSGEELDEIRQVIFKIIFTLMEGGAGHGNNGVDFPSDDEVQCIMYYISHESSARAKVQAMQLLIRLLTSQSKVLHKQLIAGFASGVKIYPLLALHVHSNPKVRTYAFLALCNVIQITTVHGTLPELKVYSSKKRKGDVKSASADDLAKVESGMQDAREMGLYLDDAAETLSEGSENSFVSDEDTFQSSTTDSYDQKSVSGASISTTPMRRTLTPGGGRGTQTISTQNSFSFIPPPTTPAPGTTPMSRFFKERVDLGRKDSFSAMGIAAPTLPYVLMWAQQNLLNMIEMDFLNSHLVDQQCRVIISILTHTLIGLPSTDVVNDIDELFSNPDDGTEGSVGRMSEYSVGHEAINEHLAESVFCVAVFVPAILRFISRDIVPYTLRFSTLVGIKTKLQSFTNCDLFMQVPDWQVSLFELVISEQRRIHMLKNRMNSDNTSVGSQSSIMKEFERSTGILDTGIRMLCDMFLHSVEYGSPAPEIVISRPYDETHIPPPKPTPITMVTDISTGKRLFGPNVLREIMSYLRCYAEKGELDIELIGISLLQQIMNALLLKRDHWNKSDAKESEHHAHIRLRNFNVCCWLAASFILEFVTSPMVQLNQSSQLLGAPPGTFVTPERKTNLTKDDSSSTNRLSLNVETGSAKSRRRRSVPNPPPALRRANSSPMPSPTGAGNEGMLLFEEQVETRAVLSSTQSPGIANRKPELVVQTGSWECVSEISDELYELRNDVTFSQHGAGINATDVFDTTMVASSPPIGVLRSSSSDVMKLDSEHDSETSNALWKLLDSVMALLESLDPNVHRKGLVGIKIAMSVGIRRSQEILDIMKESFVDQIPRSQDNGDVHHTLTGKAIPARLISSQILWRMLRVLCNIYSQSGISRGPLPPSKQNSQLQCLKRLRRMVKSLESKDWGSYKFELILGCVKITQVLRQTVHRPADSWIHESLVVLAEMIEKSKSEILIRLENVGFHFEEVYKNEDEDNSDDGFDERVSLSLPSPKNSGKSARGSRDEEDDRALSLPQRFSSEGRSDAFSPHIATPVVRSNMSEGRRPTHEAALLVVNNVLKIPLNAPLTWSVWDDAMRDVVERGMKMEDEALTSTLTTVGTHRDSQNAVKRLVVQRAEEEANFMQLSKKSEEFSKKASEHEMSSLQRLIRSSEALKKRNARSWSLILQELANERGPWGVGAEEHVEVFWTIDLNEDGHRRRMKLRRNPFGSTHSMATMFSRGRGNCDSYSEDEFASPSTSASDLTLLEEKSTLASNSSASSKTVGQGLWKDLVKYQTRVAKEPEDEGDEEDQSMDGQSRIDEGGKSDSKQQKAVVGSPDKKTGMPDNPPTPAQTADQQAGKILFSCDCEIITPSTNSMCPPAYGTIEVTSTRITFIKKGPGAINKPAVLTLSNSTLENHDFIWACQTHPSSQWATDDICNILPRTFYLRPTAVEVFLTSRKAIFFNLHQKGLALQFIMVIRNVVKPPHIAPFFGHRPQTIITKITAPGSVTALTQAWETREISNFDYLMHLNTIAGRSYSDLGQYPVFPWIIADYVSSELKLREPSTYRDLRWPMGAQSESQRRDVTIRYQDIDFMYQQSLQDDMMDMGPALPPFHYGSHYSTAGFVMWYLMRLEPFTSLHVQLQEGRFDKTDRLFDSIESAWRGCTTNISDVKELVPEFYSCPEMFENLNKLDLGKKSGSRRAVSDIVLPPWASDPFDFVRLNRKALESEYVSQNLHHWIDLIFGYKQRPPYLGGDEASVSACNVFYHLTYADAVNLEELLEKDKKLHQTYVNQIAEFGQTPTQLFTTPHPQRLPIDAADIAWPIASVVLGADTIMKGDVLPDKPRKILCFKCYKISVWPIIFIAETAERLVSLDTSRVVGNHLWQSLPPDVVPPYRLKVDAAALELSHGLAAGGGSFSMMGSYSSSSNVRDKRVGVPFLNQMHMSQPSLTSQEADEDSSKAEPVPKKEFLRMERDFRRITANKRSSAGSSASSSASTKLQYSHTPSDIAEFIQDPSSSSGTEPGGSPVTSSTVSTRSTPARKSMSSQSSNMTPANRARNLSYMARRRGRSRAIDEHLSSQLFAVHYSGRILFSCGHWDHSFKATALDSGRLMQSVTAHKDAVTCLTLATDFGRTWLVTGSRDCTLMIWDVNTNGDLPLGNGTPSKVLYGHDDAVSCVAVNTEMDVVVSGSDDGTVIIHSLREGLYTRTILIGVSPTNRQPSTSADASTSRRRIHWVGVTKESYVVVYVIDEHLLCTYTVNGRLVAKKDVRERLYAFLPSEDGQVLVTGGENCLVVFRWVHSLELANDGPRKGLEAVLDGLVEDSDGDRSTIASPIRSLYFSRHERHLIVGTEAGDMRVFAQDSDYLRQRLQRKLEEIGIL